MVTRWLTDISFTEQGDIYFFYKPKRRIEKVSRVSDVARFFLVLDPYGKSPARYIVMGNKRMPAFNDGGDTAWGFVQMVGGRGFETFRKQSAKPPKDASRPVGEGIYSIITHRNHTHLLYSLELPEKPGHVQKDFHIANEGNYILQVRPVEVSPDSPDIPFSNFVPMTPEYLNRRGTEVLLVGIGSDIGRLGIRAEKDKEDLKTADIFSKLKVDSDRHPYKPLISGDWE